jgi:hypothetical protein
MDLFKLTIHPDWEQDFQVALVDDPAIERDWQKFSKQMKFKIQDEDRRIISGFAMIAEEKIPRWDEERGHYLVKFTKEAIWDIALRFFKNQLTQNTNEMHQTGQFSEGVFIFESIIIDSKRNIMTPEGFGEEPDGSWFISMKVDNDEIWEKVKAGEYRGFSIECRFNEELVTDIDEFLKDLEVTHLK